METTTIPTTAATTTERPSSTPVTPVTPTSPARRATARIAVHPSEMIPGIPRFALEVPEGWVLDEAPGALCVLRHPAEQDGFWVNVLVRHDKVPREVDFPRAATITWSKLLAVHPEAVVTGERLVRFGDRVAYTRGVEVNGPDGGKLAQLQALCFAPVQGPGKVVDLFQLVGTCRVDGAVEENLAAIVSVVAGLRFL
jgi:hypothetical protein